MANKTLLAVFSRTGITKALARAVYDTVVVFFPIWAASCPRIILTFLEENDFAGKTIIPVCTYMKTGKGKCEEDMKASCPNAKFEPCIEATALKDKAVGEIANILMNR